MPPKIKALCEEVIELDRKATPGPWEYWRDPVYGRLDQVGLIVLTRDKKSFIAKGIDDHGNAKQIVHSRSSAPALARACLVMMEALDKVGVISKNAKHPEEFVALACISQFSDEALKEAEKIVGAE